MARKGLKSGLDDPRKGKPTTRTNVFVGPNEQDPLMDPNEPQGFYQSRTYNGGQTTGNPIFNTGKKTVNKLPKKK